MKVEIAKGVEKALKKLGPVAQKAIILYLDEISHLEDPRSRGKALVGNKAGFWRYRVGDYRIICRLLDSEMVVYVLKIGHRKNIYSD